MSDDACCKSGRIAGTHGLEDYLRTLGEEWSRPDGRGLRRLATAFNKRVLRTKITRAGHAYDRPLDVEVEALYVGITDDSGMDRQRAERWLQRYGLEPEEVRRELPSYKTLHRHFRECEGRKRSEPVIATDRGPKLAQERLHALRERMLTVVGKTLRELASAGHLASAPFTEDTLTVTVQLDCPHCGDQHVAERFITDGCPSSHADSTSEGS